MNDTNAKITSGTRTFHQSTNLNRLPWAILCTLLSESVIAGGCNIPTDAPPSPLFGAQAFTQALYRLEEFGTKQLPQYSSNNGGFPSPTNAKSSPSGSQLDSFLSQTIYPLPSRKANTSDLNPWKSQIEAYLKRTLNTPPAEGRPPGEDWAHQRWPEFYPEEYTLTAQSGVRSNSGFRDIYQTHQYSVGEFAPGGLHYSTAKWQTNTSSGQIDGTTNGIEPRLHPDFPMQESNSLWTFDGTFPPKLLKLRYGYPVLFRHYNALPISPSANNGFGLHTLSTHQHNGHNPAESDGYMQAFFFPGQYYDYRWPMILAGHDHKNKNATDVRAGGPDGSGGVKKIPGDFRETMSSLWFHDHMIDFTAQNVYKGNAAMLNIYSALDRGNEKITAGGNLRFPSGTQLDWGNRDYDVNLLIADKAWDKKGQLFFNIFNLDGFLGDQMTVNWQYKPYMDVRARKYRLRLLNGSVSRYMKIAVMTEDRKPVPVYMIANDGNIMEHSVLFEKGELPTQAIAERYDIIIDFSQYAPGTKIYLVNLMEHNDGRQPEGTLSRSKAFKDPFKKGNTCDPAVGKFMEMRVQPYTGTDYSMDPADYVAGKKKMIKRPKFSKKELANARHRTFEFGRSSGTDSAPWTIKTDGGSGFAVNPKRVSAAPNIGDVEIWHFSGGGGWSHPIHVHFEEGQILSRDGGKPPEWEKWARKDIYRIGDEKNSSREVTIAVRFREFMGSYMEHCHNTQHEDHAQLLRWDIEKPGQTVPIRTPMPTWDGVTYVKSFSLPTYKKGDKDAKEDFNDN
ncbi:multicopper oxidase domain-containing protein [Photobacterium sp. BZF1]|uniref:multicopper oxidase domain-containing protein n=1 Tax=Photobacterium sp. BZF1 TaxID=1904457 RepID=UPI001CA38B51|nr:multicopper oxidase domain-containing protein [Photobacterium sp. BZF1]